MTRPGLLLLEEHEGQREHPEGHEQGQHGPQNPAYPSGPRQRRRRRRVRLVRGLAGPRVGGVARGEGTAPLALAVPACRPYLSDVFLSFVGFPRPDLRHTASRHDFPRLPPSHGRQHCIRSSRSADRIRPSLRRATSAQVATGVRPVRGEPAGPGAVRHGGAGHGRERPAAGQGQRTLAPYTWSTVIFTSTLRSETMAARYSSQSGCSPAALR